MKYFSLRNRQGYTLLEMVIAISLFVIISVIVMNNFRQGQRMDDLRTGAVEMASNFREVQTLGMSGQVVNICHEGDSNLDPCISDLDCPGGGICGLVPIGGFGIAIEPVFDSVPCYDVGSTMECPERYTLFADIAGTAGRFEVGTDIPLEGKNNYPLPNNVRIRDFDVICSWVDAPGFQICPNADSFGIDVSFRPPKPTPFFFTPAGSDPKTYSEQTIKILLEHEDTEKCRMVVINGVSGEVSEIPDSDCSIL